MPEYDSTKRFKVPTFIDKESGSEMVERLYKDAFDTVMNDRWMFIVVWGQQRLGKSTLALWIVYFLWRLIDPNLTEDELWERVYDGCVFNLSQLMYKMRSPDSHRVWDYKHRHFRVPIFMWDDFGAHSNKAVTQHEEAWDYFKGGFDVLGTKFGIIVITLTTPEQPTNQIEHKYTHEIVITSRGRYKYDAVEWQQDFRGWSAKHSKSWQQESNFGEIPWSRFSPYDEMRVSLADEVLERIDDAMRSKMPALIKRMSEDDINILKRLRDLGPLNEYQRDQVFGGERKAVLVKLKAHQLVAPVRRKKSFYIDITQFGLDSLEEWEKKKKDDDEE